MPIKKLKIDKYKDIQYNTLKLLNTISDKGFQYINMKLKSIITQQRYYRYDKNIILQYINIIEDPDIYMM